MLEQMKQRVIGVAAMIAVAAVFIPLVFHHGSSTVRMNSLSDVIPKAPDAPIIYDLPLKGQESITPSQPKHKEFDGVDTTTTPEALRAKALKTTDVTAHILRTHIKPQPVIPVHSSKVKSARDPVQNKVSSQILSNNWVVQLASFDESSRAMHLYHQLRTMGLTAYTQLSSVNAVQVTRVFVGPYKTQLRAQQLQKQLEKWFHLKGIVQTGS